MTTSPPIADKRIAGALTRYRVLAWITGVWLLVLTTEMIYKYIYLPVIAHEPVASAPDWLFYIGQAHGIFYMIYLALAIDLAIKVRWKATRTIGTLLAGTIPFLSFVAERRNTEQVKRDFGV